MPNMNTGSITASGSANAVSLTFSKPDSNFSVSFYGSTFTGATIQLQGKDSSGNWEALACKDMGNGLVNNGGTAFSLSDGVNKMVAGDCGCFKAVRVYCDAITGGTLSVLLQSDNFGAGQIIPSYIQATNASSLVTPVVVTGTNANAFDVGQNGQTNPALQVDTSTATSRTGLKIKSAAAAGGLALSVITSGTNENLTIDAASAGTISLATVSTGAIVLGAAVTVNDAKNFALGTTTGSQLGTATNQKLAFFGKTPVVQPSTTGTLLGFNGNGATNANAVNFNANGNTGSTNYSLGDLVFNLKTLGLIAA